jgi:hypothetical protein
MQFKAKRKRYIAPSDNLEFYQYAFTKSDFSKLIHRSGFRIIDQLIYDYAKGISDEIPLLRSIFKIRGLGWRFKLWIKSREFGKNLGHMILFVCKKV